MLDQATETQLAALGIDVAGLTAAIKSTEATPFTLAIKPEAVKTLFPTHSFLSEDELNGLKGRTKNETLTQATELGIKAIKEAAGVTFEGKDPAKFIEALTAHLKIPVDSKLTEKENEILTIKQTYAAEKLRADTLEAKFNDIDAVSSFSKLLPEDFMKAIPAKVYRATLADSGIEVKDYEGKQAVYVNGQVQKDKELNLIDAKTFISAHAKENGFTQVAAATAAPAKPTTFDTTKTGQTTKFDHNTAYQTALKAGEGKWNEKAQATYTELMTSAGK